MRMPTNLIKFIKFVNNIILKIYISTIPELLSVIFKKK